MTCNGTGRCACGAMTGEDCDCPRVYHNAPVKQDSMSVPAGIKDAINPSHYKQDPSGVECIQVTRHRNFNVGNALKYLWRAGLKDIAPSTEDLRKAIWYLEDEIGRLEGTGTHAGQGAGQVEKKDV